MFCIFRPSFAVLFAIACGLVLASSPTSALALQSASNDLVDDQFTSEDYAPRKAARGDWKIEKGVASVEQDPVLFEKHKKHGPILIYTVPHDDAKVTFEVKPSGCKTVVFTMDAEEGGHAFRVKLRTAKSAPAEGDKAKKNKKKKGRKTPKSVILTYAAKVGDAKAKEIILNSTDVPMLIADQWNKMSISVSGDKATVELGGKTIDVEHERIDQKKKLAKLGFSFGSLSVKDFKMSSAKK